MKTFLKVNNYCLNTSFISAVCFVGRGERRVRLSSLVCQYFHLSSTYSLFWTPWDKLKGVTSFQGGEVQYTVVI